MISEYSSMNTESSSETEDLLADGHLVPIRTVSELQRTKNVRAASRSQIDLANQLTIDLLGIPLSETEKRRMRRMSWSAVSERIEALQVQVATIGPLRAREAVGEMATNAQLRKLFQYRDEARYPVKGQEKRNVEASSKAEVHEMTQQAMKELQAFRDSKGVPIPEWRYARGLYEPEVLASNGVAGDNAMTKLKSRKLTLEEIEAQALKRPPKW